VIEQAWLIPVLPLASFFLILFFGKRTPLRGAGIGIVAVGASFLLSLLIFIDVLGGADQVERSWTWLQMETFRLEIGMNVDGLAAMMFVVVTTVSLLVHIYSVGYMKEEPRFTWYFAALSLFTGSMLTLVIANNLFQLLVGWELVGICSYLLIGHFWEEKTNSDAAIKAFITTRTGDVPFVFGIFVLTIAAGTANIGGVAEAVEGGAIGSTVLTVAALLLFGGAIGKSAQFPLHVWLPDAMAGPTPVSALIHAATMVVAGVYMIGRLFIVFEGSEKALLVVAIIGSITMLIAALLAMVQDDIKRVLAYSTVSQLAYMVAALGIGAYTAAFFHLFTHAFFKALLFLGAGSIIHSVHSNNMSDMGGLRKAMPVTFWTMVIAGISLAGIFPLSGFWSKDAIIASAFAEHYYVLFVMALLTVFLTAFYIFRAIFVAFAGEPRTEGAREAIESPGIMTGPMLILALLSLASGWVGIPEGFGLPLRVEIVRAPEVVSIGEPVYLTVALSRPVARALALRRHRLICRAAAACLAFLAVRSVLSAFSFA
jgi:NADH-quinone oxidoreductase subunit L